ncbi:hypothetical protein ASE49_17445 [Novosphingobium sp. Leaf2]|nr:hypothetical protein ASE49_17445 [Novosphingobium sp. Leaf2]
MRGGLKREADVDLHAFYCLSDHLIKIAGVFSIDGQRVHHVDGLLLMPPIAPTSVNAEPALIELGADTGTIENITKRRDVASQPPQCATQ